MKRLTRKTNNGFVPQYERETHENYYDLVSKLGQLEDLEEEIGCDIAKIYPLFKKIFKNLAIAIDIVNEKECCATICLKVGKNLIVIGSTHDYNECLLLKSLDKNFIIVEG